MGGGDQAQAHRQLLDRIINRCDQLGLMVYHNPESIRAQPGFPDLVIVGRRILYREVKTGSGRLSPTQTTWRYKILAAGGDWRLWMPGDWAGDQIERELKSIMPAGPQWASAG